MILNLDNNFYPFPNEASIEYENFTFNGGEPHIRIQSDLQEVVRVMITQRVRSFHDFGLLLLAIDALQRLHIPQLELFLPYFPAARQDRIMQAGEALSVKVYADALNRFNLNRIHIFDPHSAVASAVLNNCQVINNHQFIQEVITQINEPLLLIAPDGGALKKAYVLAAALGGIEVVECSKVRDTTTGKLSGFRVYAEDLEGANCLIVDDICDGGGTFVGLAKELRNKNAARLYLAVSHGIFSNGFDDLQHYFTQIFTTDAFSTLEKRAGVVQFKLEQLSQKQ